MLGIWGIYTLWHQTADMQPFPQASQAPYLGRTGIGPALSLRDLGWGIPSVSLTHVWPVGSGGSFELGQLVSSQPIYDHQALGAWIVKLVSGVGTSSPIHPQGLGSIPAAPFRGERGGGNSLRPWDQDPGWDL